jgi:hypothetical protein
MVNKNIGCIAFTTSLSRIRGKIRASPFLYRPDIRWGESVANILRLQETEGARPTLAQTAFHFKCADEIDPPWGLDIFIDGANRDTWKPQCIEESTEAVIHGSHAVSNVLLLAQQIDFPVYTQN